MASGKNLPKRPSFQILLQWISVENFTSIVVRGKSSSDCMLGRVKILPTFAASLFKMSSSQDCLIVSMQGGVGGGHAGWWGTTSDIVKEYEGKSRGLGLLWVRGKENCNGWVWGGSDICADKVYWYAEEGGPPSPLASQHAPRHTIHYTIDRYTSVYTVYTSYTIYTIYTYTQSIALHFRADSRVSMFKIAEEVAAAESWVDMVDEVEKKWSQGKGEVNLCLWRQRGRSKIEFWETICLKLFQRGQNFYMLTHCSGLTCKSALRSRGLQVLRSLGEYFLWGKGREVQQQQQQ